VSHGKRLLTEIATTHRDVSATKIDTSQILELLAPATEENPVLTILEQILMAQRQQVAQLERIEMNLKKFGARLARLEQE
jgi:streptomycin 6-kinase